MSGEPVWLASVALRTRTGAIRPTGTWIDSPITRAKAEGILRWMLAGVGDRQREILFRMNLTLCMHRGSTPRERAQAGEARAMTLAGGPVEVLWRRGVPHVPTTDPCAQPVRHQIDPQDQRLWLPVDCGRCPSCRARALVQRTGLPWQEAIQKAPPSIPWDSAEPQADSLRRSER